MAPVPPPPTPSPGAAVRREPSPMAAHLPPLMAGGFLPLQEARFVVDLGTGGAWLAEQSATQHHIGNSSATINGTLRLIIYDIFTISASGSVAFPPDDASFSEQVVLEQGGGDPTTADSSLSVVRYSIAAGLRTPFWALSPTEKGWFGAALFADVGAAGIHGDRSISNCSDCRSDSLDFPGGTFWRVGLDLAAPSRGPRAGYGLTVAYQRYLAGAGLAQEFQVGLSIWLL